MVELLSESTLIARRGRLIENLMNGDPVAWTIVGGVVVFMIGSAVFNSMRNSDNSEADVADDGSADDEEEA